MPTLAQVWAGGFVTCEVVTQWRFSQKCSMLKILGVTNTEYRRRQKKQMKNYTLYICFLHFALTFQFRKYIFTQEQTFQFPVRLSPLTAPA